MKQFSNSDNLSHRLLQVLFFNRFVGKQNGYVNEEYLLNLTPLAFEAVLKVIIKIREHSCIFEYLTLPL